MDYRPFEINLTCLEGLEIVHCLFKVHAYAVVSIVGDSSSSLRQQTPVGKYFGDKPTWNFPMSFCLEESKLRQNQLVLMIQLRYNRIFGGDKNIAEVHIPFKLLDNCSDHIRVTQFGVHQVIMTPPVKPPRGYLYFSYKFGEKIVNWDGSEGI
jgi:hypothetical protein